MKKIFTTLVAVIAIIQFSYAQIWSRSSTDTTNIYNLNSGKVGIGTTSPAGLLHVYGTNNTNAIIESTGNTQAYVQFNTNGNTSYIGPSANNGLLNNISNGDMVMRSFRSLHFSANNTGSPQMTLTGGLVGIGTTTPGQALDVIGTVKATSFNVKGSTSNEIGALTGTGMGYDPINYPVSAFGVLSGSGVTAIGYNPLANSGGNFSGDGSEILFRNTVKFIQPNASGSDYLSPTLTMSNGFVGIGTNTPHEALSVNGNIRSKQVKVEMANWPDYIFKKEYKLPSLLEVKTYIDQNQHLPDMPSAKEIEKDGLNLGEMNTLLLKKVEELTLYLIEQDKQLKQQTERINKLEKQLPKTNKRK